MNGLNGPIDLVEKIELICRESRRLWWPLSWFVAAWRIDVLLEEPEYGWASYRDVYYVTVRHIWPETAELR